ncbi:hypothetical protein SAMN02745244_03627, partial [Tessaracoccus bendigoensis DSM 12906]
SLAETASIGSTVLLFNSVIMTPSALTGDGATYTVSLTDPPAMRDTAAGVGATE